MALITVDQRRLRRACASAQFRQSLRCSHTMKYGSRRRVRPNNQTSSPTGWLRMHVWRMSLRRTKSVIISWASSSKENFSRLLSRIRTDSLNWVTGTFSETTFCIFVWLINLGSVYTGERFATLNGRECHKLITSCFSSIRFKLCIRCFEFRNYIGLSPGSPANVLIYRWKPVWHGRRVTDRLIISCMLWIVVFKLYFHFFQKCCVKSSNLDIMKHAMYIDAISPGSDQYE